MENKIAPGKRVLRVPVIRAGGVLLAAWILLGAVPRPQQALDVEKFQRELERSHALATKKDRNYKRQLKTLERITRAVPDFPGPWTELARMEESAGNHRQAETDHLTALKVSDQWAGPALAYAQYLMARRKAADAAALLQSSLSTQPGSPTIAFALAEASQEGDPARAIMIWDRLVEQDDRRVDAAFKAAALEFSRGRWKEAYERLRNLRKKRPQDPEILEMSAEAAHRAGKTGDASDWSRQYALGSGQCESLDAWVRETRSAPLEACRQALERDSRCAGVWFYQAELLEADGHREESFRSYAEAYRLEPEDAIALSRLKSLAGQMLRPLPDPGPVIKMRDLKNLWAKAEDEMETGNWRKAFSTVKKMPFRYDAEYRRPFLLRMAEESKGDGELLRWADSLARTIPREGALILAAAFQGAGRSSRADELLSRLSDTWTFDPLPCERLAQNRVGLKLWDAAAQAFEEADRRDWRGRWILDEARCWAQKGAWSKASQLFVEEVERRPFQSEAYKGLAAIYEKNGRLKDAVRAAHLWAQTDPLSKEAWETYRRLLKDMDPAKTGRISKIIDLL